MADTSFDLFSMDAPTRTFRFKVVCDKIGDCQFSNISGFGATTDVVEYREGNDLRDTPIKMPGMVKYGNVTFKRGMTGNASFITWLLEALPDGAKGHAVSQPTDIEVHMLDDGEAGGDFMMFRLLNAWPANLTLPDLNASSSEIAIESLEIVHEGIVWTNHSTPYSVQKASIREQAGGAAS